MPGLRYGFRRTVLGAGLALFLAAASSAAEGPAGSSQAATSGCRGATAHDPHFGDAALWARYDVQRAAYAREAWPAGRLYVWAHPGKSGGKRFRGALDVTDPVNWLLDGKPADELVLDERADLLFPASETPYRVGFRGTDVLEVCRHVTIESGAGFVGGGDGRGRQIYGNVWIKKGGDSDCQGATKFLGGRATFFRNDNTADANDPRSRRDKIMSSQYFVFNKEGGASVEFVGHVSVLDEFRVYGCTVIVGPDSILQPGRNASPTIDQGGVLALMDGARFESWNNDFDVPEMTVRDGTIQGGLPDRPLTRRCVYGLAFKNHTGAQYTGAGADTKKGRPVQYQRVPSLIVLKGALRSHSTDLRTARLVFTSMTNEAICPPPGTEEEEKALNRQPEGRHRFAWMRQLPRGLDCFLGHGVVVDGVTFDHLRKGGILCPDPAAARGAWKNVAFGPHCAGSGDDLFAQLDGVGRRGDY
jgi:hypothetical protein